MRSYTYTHTQPLNLPNITHSKPNQIKDNALQVKTQKVIPTIMGKKPTIMDSLPSWGGEKRVFGDPESKQKMAF